MYKILDLRLGEYLSVYQDGKKVDLIYKTEDSARDILKFLLAYQYTSKTIIEFFEIVNV